MVLYWLTVARLQSLKRCLLKLQHDIYVEMTCIYSGRQQQQQTLRHSAVRWGNSKLISHVSTNADHGMDDRPHSEMVASGWHWTSWMHFHPRSVWDRNVTHHLLLCYFAALEGYLPQQSECGWNNHSRQKHDCCAWARSHCSGISANKGLNALLCMNVCGACAWILWDGGRWCCQAGKWGGSGVGGELCAHGGRGQREWTTHEYYGMVVVVGGWVGGGVQYVWGGKIAVHRG